MSVAQPLAMNHMPALIAEAPARVLIVGSNQPEQTTIEHAVSMAGLTAKLIGSVAEILTVPRAVTPSVAVIDVSQSDTSALEIQLHLTAHRPEMPLILITDDGDITGSVRAMKAGAFDVLPKPYEAKVLFRVIQDAIEHSRAQLACRAGLDALRERYASLSRREQEVMAFVASGLLNKQVGGALGISEITVKAHRGQVMRKMKASSFAELVRMATRLEPLGSRPERSQHLSDADNVFFCVSDA